MIVEEAPRADEPLEAEEMDAADLVDPRFSTPPNYPWAPERITGHLERTFSLPLERVDELRGMPLGDGENASNEANSSDQRGGKASHHVPRRADVFTEPDTIERAKNTRNEIPRSIEVEGNAPQELVNKIVHIERNPSRSIPPPRTAEPLPVVTPMADVVTPVAEVVKHPNRTVVQNLTPVQVLPNQESVEDHTSLKVHDQQTTPILDQTGVETIIANFMNNLIESNDPRLEKYLNKMKRPRDSGIEVEPTFQSDLDLPLNKRARTKVFMAPKVKGEKHARSKSVDFVLPSKSQEDDEETSFMSALKEVTKVRLFCSSREMYGQANGAINLTGCHRK